MAVSINLLPQERQAKLRDKRTRSLAVGLTIIVNGGLIGLMIIFFIITQAQKLAINRVQADINNKIEEFRTTPNVEEMLTLQQNLKSIPELYNRRVIVTRFFAILETVSPTAININQLGFNESGSLEVSGEASSMRLVTTLVRAMEASGEGARFTNVELGAVTKESSEGTVTFSLTSSVSTSVTAVGGGQ